METNQVRICVPVCERSLGEFERKIVGAAEVGDFIELRLDCLEPIGLKGGWTESVMIEELEARAQESGRPTIATFRPAEQGGLREMDYGSRYMFWSLGYRTSDFLDIELDLCLNFSSGNTRPAVPLNWEKVICSHHDFLGVPADLEQIYQRMAGTPARILKIAVQAGDVTDCLPLFRLLDRARVEKREMIAIAMGTAGVATRILGPSRGAFLTYAALESESGTAPGQLTASELRQVYRIEKIDRQTQIFGLMGLPVRHSVSPLMHNAAFEALELNAVYLPFEVKHVAEFIRRMVHPLTRELDWNLGGLSVTAPHKTAVMEHLDWIDPAAEGIGAVNTILVLDGALHGYNTDAQGLIKPLLEKVGELSAARCAVLGSGGAARAALWALRREDADLTVFARNLEKAEALATEFGVAWGALNQESFEGYDVVINTTPLGTVGPYETQTPATARQLRGARLAYDLVYNPTETQFLREAREAGCETLGGLSMLIAQAAEQFKLWTGRDAPEDGMWEAAERGLRSGISDLRSEMQDHEPTL